jgi:hypothetical protein
MTCRAVLVTQVGLFDLSKLARHERQQWTGIILLPGNVISTYRHQTKTGSTSPIFPMSRRRTTTYASKIGCWPNAARSFAVCLPCIGSVDRTKTSMRKVIQEASQELVAKLVRAGYLQHALRHDAGATTMAIARLKEICETAGTMKAPKRGRRPLVILQVRWPRPAVTRVAIPQCAATGSIPATAPAPATAAGWSTGSAADGRSPRRRPPAPYRGYCRRTACGRPWIRPWSISQPRNGGGPRPVGRWSRRLTGTSSFRSGRTSAQIAGVRDFRKRRSWA